MAETFEGREKTRFPMLLIFGVLMALAVNLAAFILLGDLGWAVLLLTVILVIAAVGMRVVSGSNRDDADSSDNVLKQPASGDRPLGDTPEAHDEISPHDLPLSNPGRHTAEKMAEGAGGTTSGHDAGGAAGHLDDTAPVDPSEAKGGAAAAPER